MCQDRLVEPDVRRGAPTEPGTRADVTACVALWARALEARDGAAPPASTAGRVRADFEEPADAFRVIRGTDGVVEAFGLVMPPGSRTAASTGPEASTAPKIRESAYLALLAVDPTRQRRGGGAALLSALMADVSRAGRPSMFLFVRTDNAVAIGLYERTGFAAIGRPFPHPSIPADFVTYLAPLDRRDADH
jgi:ribosomal protein S18 acetylase RimI-like enzyme